MQNARCYGKKTAPPKKEKSFIKNFFEGNESSESLFAQSSEDVLQKDSYEDSKIETTSNILASPSLFENLYIERESSSAEKEEYRTLSKIKNAVKKKKPLKRKKKKRPKQMFHYSTKYCKSIQPRWSEIYKHDLTIEKQGTSIMTSTIASKSKKKSKRSAYRIPSGHLASSDGTSYKTEKVKKSNKNILKNDALNSSGELFVSTVEKSKRTEKKISHFSQKSRSKQMSKCLFPNTFKSDNKIKHSIDLPHLSVVQDATLFENKDLYSKNHSCYKSPVACGREKSFNGNKISEMYAKSSVTTEKKSLCQKENFSKKEILNIDSSISDHEAVQGTSEMLFVDEEICYKNSSSCKSPVTCYKKKTFQENEISEIYTKSNVVEKKSLYQKEDSSKKEMLNIDSSISDLEAVQGTNEVLFANQQLHTETFSSCKSPVISYREKTFNESKISEIYAKTNVAFEKNSLYQKEESNESEILNIDSSISSLKTSQGVNLLVNSSSGKFFTSTPIVHKLKNLLYSDNSESFHSTEKNTIRSPVFASRASPVIPYIDKNISDNYLNFIKKQKEYATAFASRASPVIPYIDKNISYDYLNFIKKQEEYATAFASRASPVIPYIDKNISDDYLNFIKKQEEYATAFASRASCVIPDIDKNIRDDYLNFIKKQEEYACRIFCSMEVSKKSVDFQQKELLSVLSSRKSITLPEKCGSNIIHSKNNRSLSLSSHRKTPLQESVDYTLAKLLNLCNQEFVAAFADIYDWTKFRIKKIGEGSFGEVFMLSIKKLSCVLKIIPVSDDNIDDCYQGLQNTFSEIKITKCLSELRNNKRNQTKNFIKLNRASLVSGVYPPVLIEAWDHYSKTKSSYSDRPDIFGENQMFVILDLEYGGKDMSTLMLRNAVEAESILKQIAVSLAVAEEEYAFEHRDLHLGNILVKRSNKKTMSYKLRGKNIPVECHGVEVTLIDFTLSRLHEDGYIYYNDLAQEISLFEQTGDYQFDVYKSMRRALENQWEDCFLFSNVLWLKFLCKKMTESEYSRPSTVAHKKGLKAIDVFNNHLANCCSATDCLKQCGITTIHFELNSNLESKKKSILVSRNSSQKSKLSVCN